MGQNNCCREMICKEQLKSDMQIEPRQRKKVNKQVGLALKEGEFCLDQMLSSNLRGIYDQHKWKLAEELGSETTADEKQIKTRVARKVEDGTYEGGWIKGTNKRAGEGRLVYPNGAFYHGNFDKDHPNGTGLKIFTDGDVYFGDFENHQMEGHGEYTSQEGITYEGEFHRNVQEGEGTQTWPDGTTYSGGWKEGKKHGKGKLLLSNGNSYVGDFKEDHFEGKGKYPK